MTTTVSSKGRVLPRIIGHRGACGHAPENTLASFRKAAELGIQMVEFDTKLTADGEVVIFHDDTLDRTTSGSGAVKSSSLSEVRSLDAGQWFGEEFTGESVPRFREALPVLRDLGLHANVEIKPSPGLEQATAVATCEIIKNHWPEKMPKPIISSFKDTCLAVAQESLPDFERALLLEDDASGWRSRAEALECCAIHIWHGILTRDLAKDFVAAGYAVRSFTINDKKLGDQLFDWGVEGICTDFPDRFAAL